VVDFVSLIGGRVDLALELADDLEFSEFALSKLYFSRKFWWVRPSTFDPKFITAKFIFSQSPNFRAKFSFPNFSFDIFDPSKMRETFLDFAIRPSSIHQSARNFSRPVISSFFFANFWPRARLIVFERPLTFIFRPNFAQIRPRTLSSFADFRLSTFIFDFYLYTSNFVDPSFLERMRRSGSGLVKPDKTAFGFLNRALGRTSNVFRRLGAYCRYRVPVPTRGIL
jgi:hypothetical protein